jgi:hypothetical protein
MRDSCAYVMMKLDSGDLRKVLLKGSIHMIKSLVIAYPQAMGAPFLDALAPAVSPATLRMLIDEVSRASLLTPDQVKSAESEFLKIVNDEKLLPQSIAC